MAGDGWNFDVRRIDLPTLTIDASQRLGMVVVQPKYELEPDADVPFRLSPAYIEPHKELIARAFAIRGMESRQRGIPIPFILFPENAIPAHDLDAIALVRHEIERAEGDVVFIAGLEGLGPEEAHAIADKYPPDSDTAGPVFGAGKFVNICLILVKSANGHLSWHYQVKLRPSQWEQPRNMCQGQRLLYFVGTRVAFFCKICFDHIAQERGESLNAAICDQLIETAQPNTAPLDFVFVPQYNPKPLDTAIKKNTGYLLKYETRGLNANMTAVVVANCAAPSQESQGFGRSGIHYKGGRWQIPTTDVGPKGYELFDNDGVTYAVFRKRTDAIHIATLLPPSFNAGKPENARFPLESPRSYILKDGCSCSPCSCPPASCPEGSFVECDCLPCKLRDMLSDSLPREDQKKRWQGADATQTSLLNKHFAEIRGNLLTLSALRARELTDLLLLMHDSKTNPDTWTPSQFEAVVEMASALSVLAELAEVNIDASGKCTASVGEDLMVAVLDGDEKRHTWGEIELSFVKYFIEHSYRYEYRKKPLLIAALRSRGLVNPMVAVRPLNYTEVTRRDVFGGLHDFTKPASPRFYLCQDALFEGAKEAASVRDFLLEQMGGVLA